jgi:hypothetical protein
MNATKQKFEDETVYLDGCAFYDCEFIRCNLVYSGLIPVTLVGCVFTHCAFDFAGPAANTLQYLYSLAHVSKDSMEIVRKTLAPILEE